MTEVSNCKQRLKSFTQATQTLSAGSFNVRRVFTLRIIMDTQNLDVFFLSGFNVFWTGCVGFEGVVSRAVPAKTLLGN